MYTTQDEGPGTTAGPGGPHTRRTTTQNTVQSLLVKSPHSPTPFCSFTPPVSSQAYNAFKVALSGRIPVALYSAKRSYRGYGDESDGVVVINFPGLGNQAGAYSADSDDFGVAVGRTSSSPIDTPSASPTASLPAVRLDDDDLADAIEDAVEDAIDTAEDAAQLTTRNAALNAFDNTAAIAAIAPRTGAGSPQLAISTEDLIDAIEDAAEEAVEGRTRSKPS
ncbi:hypothetical protein Hamer_G002157 [Homarus americanus]|uniref:Uncharacterized protein n=1 Tax=Homarus americanus TaxID=6706 RepID=A0A8J5MTN4_HOMAM|nr:hypothetical protein Hamer_G002157 [Homarus americanus]